MRISFLFTCPGHVTGHGDAGKGEEGRGSGEGGGEGQAGEGGGVDNGQAAGIRKVPPLPTLGDSGPSLSIRQTAELQCNVISNWGL